MKPNLEDEAALREIETLEAEDSTIEDAVVSATPMVTPITSKDISPNQHLQDSYTTPKKTANKLVFMVVALVVFISAAVVTFVVLNQT